MSASGKKRSVWQRARVWALCAVFLLLWFPLWKVNQPEPTYANQPLSYWLERMADPATAAHASAILSEMGPEALPALVQALRTNPSAAETLVYSLAEKMKLAPPRHYDAPNIRATAAYLLGQMGVAGASATPHLLKALEDEDSMVRFRASRALAKIGVPALPALVLAMTNAPSAEVRKLSVQAVGHMGPVARRAAPALVAAQKTSLELTNEINEALAAIQRGP